MATTDPNDFPARMAGNWNAPITAVPAPSRGVRLDLHEEMGQIDDDDEPELPDMAPDGFPDWYDDYEKDSARYSIMLARLGTRPPH